MKVYLVYSMKSSIEMKSKTNVNVECCVHVRERKHRINHAIQLWIEIKNKQISCMQMYFHFQ
jgi:hypothetical protein